MNPVNASYVAVNDFGFSRAEELDDRVAQGTQRDWDLGAILELNVAFMRRDRVVAPLFDDADLKIV
jgi:hypothetical protein